MMAFHASKLGASSSVVRTNSQGTTLLASVCRYRPTLKCGFLWVTVFCSYFRLFGAELGILEPCGQGVLCLLA